MKEIVKVESLLGKTIKEIKEFGKIKDYIHFIMTDGTEYEMEHKQDCCEVVCIDDIEGDIEDLIGFPLLQAEEATNYGDLPSSYYPHKDHQGASEATWTFYKFATFKGYVTIKWWGVSNGCYSERADLYQIK